MKSIAPIFYLLFIICLSSCVNRIDIPEDEDAQLYIKLEMLKGESQIVADLKTSNNLNGTHPINIPNSAIITISEIQGPGVDTNNEITLEYNEVTGKYELDNTETFLSTGRTYKLEAKVENSELQMITSTTTVPYLTKISDFKLIDETEFTDVSNGNRYWQGTIGLNFSEAINNNERFCHLQIDEMKTIKVVSTDGTVSYMPVSGNEHRYFDLIDVNSGGSAVTDILQRDGFFIELDKLENNYLEIVLKSNFPITEINQVTAFLNTNLISISKEHYDYHIALHNIKKNQANIFDEPVLYNSNIDKGLGLFSSCVRMHKTLEIR